MGREKDLDNVIWKTFYTYTRDMNLKVEHRTSQRRMDHPLAVYNELRPAEIGPTMWKVVWSESESCLDYIGGK